MTQARHAACTCGQLSAECSGDPVRISVCHCLDCQRRTGSAFSAQARFPKDQVVLDGQATTYVRTVASGNRLRFHFCPSCGATVYYVMETQPEIIAVPLGAFADPSFPAPTVSVYEIRKHPWVKLEPPGPMEHHD